MKKLILVINIIFNKNIKKIINFDFYYFNKIYQYRIFHNFGLIVRISSIVSLNLIPDF